MLRKLLFTFGLVALAACSDPFSPDAQLQPAGQDQVDEEEQAQQNAGKKDSRPLEYPG